MAAAFGFDFGAAPQGAVFALSAPAGSDRRQLFGGWEAEVCRGGAHICLRGGSPEDQPLESIVAAAHPFAEEFLDIVAVEERVPLLVSNPHDAVVWRRGAHGVKAQLTASIIFAAAPLAMRGVMLDASGNEVSPPPYVPPPHHAAYRYFRYSQAAQNVFDAYRNMFLALETLLDHIAPKRNAEGETEWLTRAAGDAVRLYAADLTPFAKAPGKDTVAAFVDGHYAAVRCAVFHAKNNAQRRLAPGSLENHDIVLHQLLAVQTIVEQLLKGLFGVSLPSGGMFHSGFGHLLEKLAPATHLLVGPVECPTIDQLLAHQTAQQGGAAKVRFDGARPGTTDEWLFSSEIKCADMDFTHIGGLRLIAYVPDRSTLGAMEMFLGPMMDKMNRTSLDTNVDMDGVSKIVIRVRCILRNSQQPRRGFPT